MVHARWPRPWLVGVVVWLLGTTTSALARDLVIATVNNGHMLTLQRMTPHFERQNPGVRVRWVTLDEDRLRQEVTRDVATRGGRFDLLTVGAYEAKVWSGRGWLRPVTPSPAYEIDDLLPPVREALTQGGKLYALPFYGESSMTMVRTDLLAAAGMTLPLHPTWDQVAQAARRMHDPQRGVAGICLRGKPGWGQNMALVSTMVNTHGGQWFDTQWRPQLDTPAWRRAVTLYSDLLRRYGPPAAVANGYNENLALFSAGRCAIWVDATVAGNFVSRATESRVAENVAFLHAPVASTARGTRWLWTWSLAIPASSRQPELAQRFAEWATSPNYTAIVAKERGWQAVPPGTRASTYAQPAYRMANPHAGVEHDAIMLADQNRPTEPASPYVGIQWVGIPEFQSIGTAMGQLVAELLQPTPPSVDDVLRRGQTVVERKMREAGHLKD